MDLKDTVQIFCTPNNGLTKEMVSVDWNDNYNMQHHPSLHYFIEELWVKKSKSCIKLFNGTKFRFHGIEIKCTDKVISTIKFLLGTTNYKEFIGTNCAPFAEELVNDGITDYSDPLSYLANPVGVGAILETDEKDLVFMRRSNICAEMAGLVDRPGGHPEPDEVTFDTNQKTIDSSKVVDEIFDSVLKEIRDEINIPIEKLSPPLLLGISYNPKTWRRPSLEFYVRCHLPTEDVLSLYSEQTQAESEESSDLVIVPVSKVLDWDEFQKCVLYHELTPAAQSAIYCLQTFFS